MKSIPRDMDQKMKSRTAANVVFDRIIIFWQNAKIKTRQPVKCLDKIEILYQKYLAHKKTKSASNDEKFKNTFDNLFDIAHVDALHVL